jgi:hypothetical protein
MQATAEKGSLTVDGRTLVKQLPPAAASGKSYAFQLTTPTRPYVFAAESAADQARWMAALAQFAKAAPADEPDSGYDAFV